VQITPAVHATLQVHFSVVAAAQALASMFCVKAQIISLDGLRATDSTIGIQYSVLLIPVLLVPAGVGCWQQCQQP
jgi:hypothetical protein